MIKKLSVRDKVLLFTIIPVIVLTLINLLFANYAIDHITENNVNTYEQEAYRGTKAELQSSIEIVMNTIQSFYALTSKEKAKTELTAALKRESETLLGAMQGYYEQHKGTLGENDLKEGLKAIIRGSKYGENGYFWAHELKNSHMVINGANPKLDGQDMSEFKDKAGKKLFAEFNEIIREKGEGTTDFFWPKPGNEVAEQKIAYVALFKPLGWVLGTGEYLEDVTGRVQQECLRTLEALRFGQEGYGYFWINDSHPKIIMHPFMKHLVGKDVSDVESGDGKKIYLELIKLVKEHGKGFIGYDWPKPGSDVAQPKLAYVVYFEPWDWIIGTGAYIDAIDSNINLMRKEADREASSAIWKFGVAAIILLILFIVILSYLINRHIIRPIDTLSKTAYKIASGNLDQTLPDYAYQDEIGKLRQAFMDMQVILKTYISELTDSTAVRERIQSELDIANNIQKSILERDFPDTDQFALYAHMQAAKEVGGDFYDFFYLDENTLVIVIGDVSGKGVPAALFMAVTKTLVKARSSRMADAGTIITWVNDELCSKNDSSMFVTLFMGVLKLDSGEMLYCNAGHNFPCIKHNDGHVSWVSTEEIQPALGFMDGIGYRGNKLCLQPGETFILYTDGVTEAFNVDNQMYGEEKLLETLTRLSGNASNVADGLLQDVKVFAGEAPQSDDITILTLNYYGKGERMSAVEKEILTISNKIQELHNLKNRVELKLEKWDVGTESTHHIILALDELVTNTISYGYEEGAEDTITVRLEKNSDTLEMELIDSGRPYNPLEKEDPNVNASMEEREIGGLGIYFVKQFMDTVEYAYVEDQNHLKLTKKIGDT